MMTQQFAQMSFPEIYERELVEPLFRPFAEATVDPVRLAAGDRVLDIACGTGIVARLAKQRLGESAKVVGVDLNPGMLAVAQKVAPEIEWRQGDAVDLPLRDGEQFDVVLCHQGFQFVPDRAVAAREMHRALAPDGRLAVSTWRPDDEIPFVRELRRVAERHVGPVTDRRHSFGETGPLEAVFREAGFRDVRSMIVTRTVRFRHGMVFVRLNATALVGMSAAGKEMDEQAREKAVSAVVGDSAEVNTRYSDEKGLAFELSTNVVSALR